MISIVTYTIFMALLVLVFFSVTALVDWAKKVFKKGEGYEPKNDTGN